MAVITLPWPVKELWPNRKSHWTKLSTARKKQHSDAYYLTKTHAKPETPVHLIITFCPPDNRKRDIDNMLAAMKAALDGMASAWGIDDKDFQPITLLRGAVVKGGAVTVQVKSPR